MSEQDFDKATFDYIKARRAVDYWVDHLNNKHVNWSWEIFMGCAEVYANFAIPVGGTHSQALASIYYDFFDAWHNGSANHGIIGIMQEMAAACPDEHVDDLDRIMAAAWEAGKTGKGVPKAHTYCMTKTNPTKGRPLAPESVRHAVLRERQPALAVTSAPMLTLVADNTRGGA
jgi:hypothetical protein